MKPRPHDPLRLDVAALAAEAAALSGDWPAAELPRLTESQSPPQDGVPSAVHWQVRGERRLVAGAEAETWLHLQAQARVWLTCQRCLQPFQQPLAIDTRLRFVRDESQAEALDAEIDEDVLALPRWLDLRNLVEDELLLGLPLVPRHERCPRPLPLAPSAGDEPAAEAPANPFAVLQSLKSRSGKPPV
jgi:uncharacterized protein